MDPDHLWREFPSSLVEFTKCRHSGIGGAVAALLVFVGCIGAGSGQEKPPQVINRGVRTVRMLPEAFMNVDVELSTEYACSPPEPTKERWRGIVVKAPERIYFTEDDLKDCAESPLFIPICGYLMLDIMLNDDAPPMEFIAVSQSTGKEYRGFLESLDEQPDIPDPDKEPLDPADVEGMASGGHFVYDLLSYVKIPIESTKYDVHIGFSGKKSNVVTIWLIEEK